MANKLRQIPVPVFIFFVSLLLTVLTALYVLQSANREDSLELENSAIITQQRIDDRINNYIALLRAGAGMFAGSENVTYQEFKEFVERLNLDKYYPGIQGIGYAQRTSPVQINSLVSRINNTYFPSYAVRPIGEREVYFPIVYLEPQNKRNEAAMGFDMYSQETRREAMRSAWINGTSTTSGKVTLVQEIEGEVQAGFLIYTPMYIGGDIPETEEQREQLLHGFIYSPFRAGDLLNDIAVQSHNEGIDFVVYEGTETIEENLMYMPKDTTYINDKQLHRVVPINVGGRDWTIEVYANDNFDYSDQRDLVPYMVLAGVAISTLLYLLSRSQYQSRERIARILNSITDGFFSVDKNWNFTYLNSEANKVLSQGETSLKGKNMWDVFPGFEKNIFGKAYKKAMKERRAIIVEGYYEFNDSWFEARAYPSGRGLSIYFQDITKRKQLENQKDEFLGIASHELKTPVTSVKAYGQLLERKFKEKGDKESSTLLHKMNKQIDRLSLLINDLLDVSRIQSGKIQFRFDNFDIVELVNDTVEDMNRTTNHKITIKSPKKVKGVYGDSERIGQVLTNLISNAIKYSEGKEKVDVILEAQKSTVSICVKDYGIGIPKKEQKRIFERFYRSKDARQNNFAGVGLGLYISNEIVKRHGGKMTVKSEAGKGSEFCFIIPYRTSNGKRK